MCRHSLSLCFREVVCCFLCSSNLYRNCYPAHSTRIDLRITNPKNSDFKKAIKKVYLEIKKKEPNWKKKKIRARFICALSISYLNKTIACVEGKVEGFISSEPRGKNGFGYDPIFIPLKKKKTFGEMNPLKKCKLDHRYKAFKKIKKFF